MRVAGKLGISWKYERPAAVSKDMIPQSSLTPDTAFISCATEGLLPKGYREKRWIDALESLLSCMVAPEAQTQSLYKKAAKNTPSLYALPGGHYRVL